MSLGGIELFTKSGLMTGAACVMGNALGYGTNYKEVALATASTTIPLGIASQDAAQNANVGFWLPSDGVVVGIASAAIAKGVLVGATTGAKFVTVTKGGTATETDYCWGTSFSAAGADLDYFAIAFNWFEMNVT